MKLQSLSGLCIRVTVSSGAVTDSNAFSLKALPTAAVTFAPSLTAATSQFRVQDGARVFLDQLGFKDVRSGKVGT